MIKRLLAAVLMFLATSYCQGSKPNADLRTVDPKDILFSLPTICDPAPAVETMHGPAGARALHEDDWRQIEFVATANLDYISRELTTLAAFKKENRRGVGWTQVYVRKEHPAPLANLALRFASLPALPESALTLGGRPVRGGFALSDAGGWFLYGQRKPEGGILHLAVSPSPSVPSEQFARALVSIAQTDRLLLVDWYAGALVDTKTPESILAWTRRYRRQ
jgi:hypothetical protein